MSDYITTYSGIHFYPAKPNRAQIRLCDIAHPLSLMTRANGHFPEFYSVAQHCIGCCNEAKARAYSDFVAFACLLHDGSEAYLADITRPVKQHLQEYLAYEKVLQDEIYMRFLGRLPDAQEESLIRQVDDAMLSNEFYHYMGEDLFETRLPLASKPKFFVEAFTAVEEEYLSLARGLGWDE